MEKRDQRLIAAFFILGVLFITLGVLSQISHRTESITGFQVNTVNNNLPIVSPNLAKIVELEVTDYIGVARINSPVINGVPIKMGEVNAVSQLQILTLQNGIYYEIPSQFKIINLWPDGSIRWVQIMFFADVSPNSASHYYLHYGAQVTRLAVTINPLTKVETQSQSIITTGAYEIGISKSMATIFDYLKVNGVFVVPPNSQNRAFYFKDDLGTIYDTRNTPTEYTWEEDGDLTKLLTIRGNFKNGNTNYLTYVLRERFFAGTSQTQISIVFENKGLHSTAVGGGVSPIGIKVDYSNHKWFDRVWYSTDLTFGTTKTLDLAPLYSVPNYVSGAYTVYVDASPATKDQTSLPTFTGTNIDATKSNLLDNNYIRIRDGSGNLVYNAGPSSYPVNLNGFPTVSYAPGSISEGGPFQVSDGVNTMGVTFLNMWQLFPKSYSLSTVAPGANSLFEINFYPEDTTYNDLVHDQGPLHFYDPNDVTKFNAWGSTPCTDTSNSNCNLEVPRTTTSYNLLSGKVHEDSFSFNFDPTPALPITERAKAFQHPLIALAPSDYYGPTSSNSLMNPLYISSRDYSTQIFDSNPLFNAALRTAALMVIKWGKSIWDPTAVCTITTRQCYTLLKIIELGSGYDIGQQHYGAPIYGAFDWDGTPSQLSESYSHLESTQLQALQNRDSRPITEVYLNHDGIDNTWRFDVLANAPNAGMVYQKGDYWIGSDSSPRHSLYPGIVLHDLITNDLDLRESIIMGASRPAGWLALTNTGKYDTVNGKSLSQVLSNPPWVSQLSTMNPYYGVGYSAKALRNVVYLYDLTGNVEYLTIAKGYITNLYMPWEQNCRAKYGVSLFLALDTTVPNWLQTCTLQNGNTKSETQIWLDAYLIQTMTEIVDRDKIVTGSYDSVIYPWLLQVIQGQFNLLQQTPTPQITPYINYVDGPNSYIITTIPFSSINNTIAQSYCGVGFTAGKVGYDSVGYESLSSGTDSGTLIRCWHSYKSTSNLLYVAAGFSWYYHETGDLAMANFLKLLLRDSMLRFFRNSALNTNNLNDATLPAESPTFRGGYGATDIKQIAPILHDSPLILAALTYPHGSAVLPVCGDGIMGYGEQCENNVLNCQTGYSCSTLTCQCLALLGVSFIATPPNSIPGSIISLSADVIGTDIGPIDYSLWWNCNNPSMDVATVSNSCGSLPNPATGLCASNSVGYKCNSVLTDLLLVNSVYSSAGSYYAKIIVGRSTDLVESRIPIIISTVATEISNPATNFDTIAIDETSVQLTWTDNSGPPIQPLGQETAFKLQYQNPSNGNWGSIIESPVDSTSYTYTGLTPGTTYQFRIRAFNSVGSAPYVYDSATTPSVSGAPSTPTGLIAVVN